MCGGEKRKSLLAAWRVGIWVGGGVFYGHRLVCYGRGLGPIPSVLPVM